MPYNGFGYGYVFLTNLKHETNMRTKEEILSKMFEEMPYQMIGKEQLLPYIKEAMEVYAQEQVKNIAYEPVLATVDFVYTGEHEESGGGRPFLNQLTGKFFYRKDLQRYFTDEQIATIKPYGG